MTLHKRIRREDYALLDEAYRSSEEVQTMFTTTLDEYGQKLYEEGRCEILWAMADRGYNMTGIDAATPAEILAHHQAAWTRCKCERVARFGAHYAQIIRDHLPDCIIGAYMCPWTLDEFDGALTRIFAQDYDLLAPVIDIFTPLIYVKKSGRTAAWGRQALEAARAFVPAHRLVQLILDALDFPDSLLETAASPIPSHGLQMFGAADILRDPEQAAIFAAALEQMQAG